MSKILAIDTASGYLSLALGVDGCIKSRQILANNRHSSLIIPEISALLQEAGLKLKDIATIIYNRGPGSFTGLRIGLSVALGMLSGSESGTTQLCSINSFELFAHALSLRYGQMRVLVGIDARLGQIYLAGIDTSNYHYFLTPRVTDPREIELIEDVIATGDGFLCYQDLMTFSLESANWVLSEYPSASNMIALFNKGCYQELCHKVPKLMYLRDKVALNMTEQQFQKNKLLN